MANGRKSLGKKSVERANEPERTHVHFVLPEGYVVEGVEQALVVESPERLQVAQHELRLVGAERQLHALERLQESARWKNVKCISCATCQA